MKSDQERLAPNSICFGCGPANTKGLRIRSFEDGDSYILKYTPEHHHQAFPDVINGGIIGTLFDCHMNWRAVTHLMKTAGSSVLTAMTVTANFSISLKRPTPANVELIVDAKVLNVENDRIEVEAVMTANGKVTATGKGLFVAVKEGHPAYHRWN
ncbi:MAG: PaaI family thioesterase [Candidatus Heimdallarchaeota archaeon]|nr:PaaI family thioesterase [Candidatus Heimdallarchaeota archaeon]MDH5647809.1 PaaI family thioesterase [Candidatus Heimdallarchaeota archaeon]